MGSHAWGSSVEKLLINENTQIKISDIEKRYQTLKKNIFSPINDIQTNYNVYLDSLIILNDELKAVRAKSFLQIYNLKLDRNYLDEFSRLDKKSKNLHNAISSLFNTYKEYNPSIHKDSYSFEFYRNNIQNFIDIECSLH